MSAANPLSLKLEHPAASITAKCGHSFPSETRTESVKFEHFEMQRNLREWHFSAIEIIPLSVIFYIKEW